MTLDALARLLLRLQPDLDALAEPWCVIGSGAMMLAGTGWPECADLDLLTTAAGAEFLEAGWADWRDPAYAPDPEAPFSSRFSRYDFRPGPVEVMGDLRVLTKAGWEGVVVHEPVAWRLGEGTWPAPGVAEQRRILELFGRPKDLAKRDFLARL